MRYIVLYSFEISFEGHYDFDLNNELGIPDTMNADECCSVLYTDGDFTNIKSMIISSFFIDYVVCHVPAFTGSRLIAAILSGICAGLGYSIFFNEGSSTGGTDFIIVAIKKWKSTLSFGFLAFVIDGIVIILSVFIFKEIETFFYGMVYTIVTSIALDLTTKLIERYKY